MIKFIQSQPVKTIYFLAHLSPAQISDIDTQLVRRNRVRLGIKELCLAPGQKIKERSPLMD